MSDTIEFYDGAAVNDVFADKVYRIDVFGSCARIVFAVYKRQNGGPHPGGINMESPITVVVPVDQLPAIAAMFCKQHHDLLHGGEGAPTTAILN